MTIQERIQYIRNRIERAEIDAGRTPGSVKILAVSKKKSVSAIREAIAAGVQDFGENYLQEALLKIKDIGREQIHWHFIGPIQSNKAQDIALNFDWVHSVDRLKIAKLLSEARTNTSTPLNICIQVNLDEEASKSGVEPAAVSELISELMRLPGLQLRGLMAIPKRRTEDEEQYNCFIQLNHLLKSLNLEFNLNMDTLSMGMSHDFPAAIRAGSTIVRIGQAIFGERQ